MSVVTLTFDVNKILRVPVWQTNSYNWKFFPMENFFSMKTVEIGNIYHFSGLEKRKHFHNKVIHDFLGELL